MNLYATKNQMSAVMIKLQKHQIIRIGAKLCLSLMYQLHIHIQQDRQNLDWHTAITDLYKIWLQYQVTIMVMVMDQRKLIELGDKA